MNHLILGQLGHAQVFTNFLVKSTKLSNNNKISYLECHLHLYSEKPILEQKFLEIKIIFENFCVQKLYLNREQTLKHF